METIHTGKIDVINTKMLNNEDIKDIINQKQKTVIIADLMDI